jgi:dolichyl-phosphate-mannose-protein mannosyltransferase
MTSAISRWVPRGRTATILGLVVVVLLAAFVRFDGLGTPDTFIADEGFYAPDGCLYVRAGHQCDRSVEASPEHPPLGKWLIGLGIKATSFTPQGWRLAPAIAGTLTVALLFLLALRLFGSAGYATFTGALLALDPLHIVQSRIATLDVFVTLFGVAAVLFAVLDYQHPSDRLAPAWRLAAGVAAGAAVASKWSGLFALALVVVLCLARPGTRLTRKLASAVITFGLVPLAVYVLTFAGRVHGKLLAAPWSHDSVIRALVHRQVTMWRDQTGNFVPSTYQSPPWSWPLLKRPEVHYASVANHQIREVLAIGSPVVWWFGFGAFVAAAIVCVRSRGRDLPSLVVPLTVACTYLPWLVLAHGRSFVFLYYMTPVVPFLCLAVGWACWSLRARVRVLAPAVAVCACLLLLFWWPVLTANPISFGAWRSRVVFHDCRSNDQPEKLPMDANGQPRAWLQLLHGRPPGGWCWV